MFKIKKEGEEGWMDGQRGGSGESGEGETYPCTVEDGPGRRCTSSLKFLGLCKCIVSNFVTC